MQPGRQTRQIPITNLDRPDSSHDRDRDGGSVTEAFSFSYTNNHNNRFGDEFNLKRTVNNNSGSSSFNSQDLGQNKFMFGSSSTNLTLPDSNDAVISVRNV